MSDRSASVWLARGTDTAGMASPVGRLCRSLSPSFFPAWWSLSAVSGSRQQPDLPVAVGDCLRVGEVRGPWPSSLLPRQRPGGVRQGRLCRLLAGKCLISLSIFSLEDLRLKMSLGVKYVGVAGLLGAPAAADEAPCPGYEARCLQHVQRSFACCEADSCYLGEVGLRWVQSAVWSQHVDHGLAYSCCRLGEASGLSEHPDSGVPLGALFAAQWLSGAVAEFAAFVPAASGRLEVHRGFVLGVTPHRVRDGVNAHCHRASSTTRWLMGRGVDSTPAARAVFPVKHCSARFARPLCGRSVCPPVGGLCSCVGYIVSTLLCVVSVALSARFLWCSHG